METIPHYYGNIVRNIFLICGILLLVTLPFLKDSISSPLFFSILSILVLTFFAGVTNPKHRGIIASDIIVSIVFFGIFAYRAVSHFDGFWDLFFLTHIVLACLCLLAFYWCLKTWRWLNSPVKIPIENIPASGTPGEGLTDAEPITIAPANTTVVTTDIEHTIIHKPEENPQPHQVPPNEEERRKNRFLRSES